MLFCQFYNTLPWVLVASHHLVHMKRVEALQFFQVFKTILIVSRAVASPSLPGGHDKNIPSICPHFPVVSLIFSQIFLIFFLILVFRVGGSPTREGPGYATDRIIKKGWNVDLVDICLAIYLTTIDDNCISIPFIDLAIFSIQWSKSGVEVPTDFFF